MRNILSLNESWQFHKDGFEEVESVNLPHTWNAIDGMDGGGDYWRGKGIYEKTITRSDLPEGQRIYLEYGDKFEWPDLTAPDGGDGVFCYGLRDQIGVLCDGTVVPCCLDGDSNIPLGNLFDSTLIDILDSPRAKAIYDGFTSHKCTEDLCKRCMRAGYYRKS